MENEKTVINRLLREIEEPTLTDYCVGVHCNCGVEVSVNYNENKVVFLLSKRSAKSVSILFYALKSVLNSIEKYPYREQNLKEFKEKLTLASSDTIKLVYHCNAGMVEFLDYNCCGANYANWDWSAFYIMRLREK